MHGIYAVMLMKNFGTEFSCVDRLSIIKFLKLGKGTLFVQFELSQNEIDEVRALVEKDDRTDQNHPPVRDMKRTILDVGCVRSNICASGLA